MPYITLDTCVWLELLKIDLHNDNNVFEEICFWIENKHLIHVTPENIVREWDRNKTKKSTEIIKSAKNLDKMTIGSFKGTPEIYSAYNPDAVDEAVLKRIDRVESILKVHSELAKESQAIYNLAVQRNLNCLAPNHSQDSFRDTLNIITLLTYLESTGYADCLFSTLNYTDFSSAKSNRQTLHPDLADDFKGANLEYVYCDEDPFANKLLNVHLRPILPSFEGNLKKKKDEEEEKALALKKSVTPAPIPGSDADFLENVKHIDLIIAKKAPTAFEKELLKLLVDRHESYKQYFIRNIGNNGMV